VTDDEIIDLLTCAAAYDRRTAGDADVDAWLAAIGDLDFQDARQAVIAHYTESSDWLMPVHIKRRVAAMRARRVTDTRMPAPPPELADNPRAYIAWLRAAETAIASGRTVEEITGRDTLALPPRRPYALPPAQPRELEAGQ